MISNTNTSETESKISRQEASAKLRESFLTAIGEFNGQSCNILTYEQTRLMATFSGWKTDGKELLVRDLKTPAGITMAAALIRTPDIIAIELDDDTILLP